LQANVAGPNTTAAFVLVVTTLEPFVASKWNTIIQDCRAVANQTGQIAQVWGQTVVELNVGDILNVGYYALGSPAGWGNANTWLSATLIAPAGS
jgi:hypothetical protein